LQDVGAGAVNDEVPGGAQQVGRAWHIVDQNVAVLADGLTHPG
jgi:hypothetical protein